jgi:hypothetical protein
MRAVPSNSTAPAHDYVEQEKENDGPDKGSEDRARETAEGRADPELTEDPATYEGPEDADDDVADQPNTADQHRCEYAGYQADYEPGEEIHRPPPVRVEVSGGATGVPLRAGPGHPSPGVGGLSKSLRALFLGVFAPSR